MREALTKAESKAAGIAPLYAAKMFANFDYGLLEGEIKWVNPVPPETIKVFMVFIAHAIVKGTL